MSGKPRSKNTARVRLVLTLSIFLTLAFLFVAALPSSSKATRQPGQADGNQKRARAEFVPGEVLVRYKSESIAKRQTRQVTLKAEGRDLAVRVDRFEGSDIVPGLRIARVNSEDTTAAIAALKKQPDVLYAEPNYLLYLDVTPNDPCFPANSLPGCQFSSLYGLTKIGATTAWNTTTGSTGPNAIVVGVVDEGIDVSHPDLQANIWINTPEIAGNGIDDDGNGFIDDVNGYNFAANSGTIPAENHATHVSGTIGAVGDNSIGVVGVNWTVRLMSLRFIDGGSGSTADAIRACDYAKQMRDLWLSSGGTKGANIRVLNNSYGGAGFTHSFLDAINNLNQSGILFVAAAGNVDSGTPEPNNDLISHYPSSYDAPNVIAVAATDSSDNLAGFSHFGAASVHLGAPGVGILSTTTGNTYSVFKGTSMATPHVAGAAALLWAQYPNLTVQQVKNFLLLNGDVASALVDKTVTGRRLNIANSFAAAAEPDTTPPGSVTNFHLNSQNGRALNVGWTASGDDGASGQAALYQITFTDASSGVVLPLKSALPAASETAQSVDVKLPYRHRTGTLSLREFDNVANEGTPVRFNVAVGFADGDPYATALGVSSALSTGGTALELIADDGLKSNFSLPFSFPFFGQSFSTVTISTNGNLYFSTPPTRPNGDADDVPSSSVDIAKFKMISGLWDDLRTDERAGDDVYVVMPDPSRIIFRWQGVTFGDGTPATEFPVNFEIELQSNGTIVSRYGTGQSAPTNTNIFPVVGIAGGEPDAYVIPTHTSETASINLTNALSVTYIPRGVVNPLGNADFFVDQHYSDFLNRVPDEDGLNFWTHQIIDCGTDQACIDIRRINVSAAFFLSIEFQQTGYLVERMYKAAYGDAIGTSTFNGAHQLSVPIIRFNEFLADTRQIGLGVVIGQPGADQLLENNKAAFAADFVSRTRFTTAFPAGMSAAQFVDTLNSNAGNPLSQSERDQLVSDLGSGAKTRAQVLRAVAEDQDLFNAENNRAFVLAQYFGYLRRNPNEGQDTDYSGYDFWLTKLNQFNGNFVNADMVKAFIVSSEYRERFGP